MKYAFIQETKVKAIVMSCLESKESRGSFYEVSL